MLAGKTILITAGPTWEAIDPVRGITNHSSGKMGYSIAGQAAKSGAKVILVSGPVCLAPPAGIKTIHVQSAQNMYDAIHTQLSENRVDIFIAVAAVADYRPVNTRAQKIKKSAAELTLSLIRNPDIVSSVAKMETRRPYTVAFAAETENLYDNAYRKLIDKKLDMIVANDVSKTGTGFGSDENQALIITREQSLDSGIVDKSELARTILLHINKHMTP